MSSGDSLISDNALKKYKKYKDKLEAAKTALLNPPPVITIQTVPEGQVAHTNFFFYIICKKKNWYNYFLKRTLLV